MITVKSRLKDYDVEFVDTLNVDGLNRFDLIVVDENVLDMHHDLFKGIDSAFIFQVEVDESRKTLDYASTLLEHMVSRGLNKRSVIGAIGGGIIQDLVGFVANIYFRGIKWEYYPTTLLAMGDSCIGGKTSINFKAHKNILGTFYPPERIVIYVPFLSSLPEKDYMSGLAEVLKINLVHAKQDCAEIVERSKSASLDDKSLRNLIYDTLVIKRDIIEEDEFDTGRRNQLNFGHCVGHALESTSGFRIPHGLAVHVGMRISVDISRQLGLISDAKAQHLERYFDRFYVVDEADRYLNSEGVIKVMLKDKKRIKEGLTVICPIEEGGVVMIHDISPNIVEKALHYAPDAAF